MNKLLIIVGAIIGIVLLVWVVFVDMILERVIEREGTRIVGARVELDNAHLSILPAGVELTRLQVTDPGSPMTNAVEVDRLSASVDLGLLIKKKVRVTEAAIERVRFGTARTSSGAVAGAKAGVKTPAKRPSISIPSLEFPDPGEILKTEQLETLKLAETLKKDMAEAKADWSGKIDGVLDTKKIEEFKRRAEALQKGAGGGDPLAMVGAAKEVASLKSDIEAYVNELKGTQKRLKDEISSLSKRVNEVKGAPERDIKRLKEKYSLTGAGIENLSTLIVGERVAGLVEKGTYWYERLAPVLADSDGKAKAAEKPAAGGPAQDLSVDLAKISVELAAGTIAGEVRNISSGPTIPSVPATFDFTGDKLKGLDSVKVSGSIDRTDPTKAADRAKLRVTGYRAKDVGLKRTGSMPITMSRAVVDLGVTASLDGKAGDTIGKRRVNAEVDAGFNDTKIMAQAPEGANRVMGIVADAISGVDAFRLKAKVSGTLDDYDLKLESDLDRILKGAVGGAIKGATEGFERELRSAVLSETKGAIGGLGGDLGGLTALSDRLAGGITESGSVLSGIGAPKPSTDATRDKTAPPIKLPGGGEIKLPF